MNENNWRRFQVEVNRVAKQEPKPFRMESPSKAYELFAEDSMRRTTESLWVLTVDGRNGLMAVDHVYSGTATGTSVRIAELFRYAMASGGVGIVLVRNHPSGDPEPSLEDLKLTQEVLRAARIMDIEFLDHLVVADGSYTSIRSQNPSIWTDEIEQPDIMERIQAL